MVKQWWYRRRVVSAAKALLRRVERAVAKARKGNLAPAETLDKVADSATALREALTKEVRDCAEVERLAERLQVEGTTSGLVKPKHVVLQYVESIAWAVGIALLVRSFLFEPFKIPTGSMIPSLLIDDYIFVTKSSYGVKLPFADSYLVRWGEPARGDVVVFPYPVKGTPDYDKDFIKRVVALPGERVRMRDNVLEINGLPIEVERLQGEVPCAGPNGYPCRCVLQKERLGEHEVITQHFVTQGMCVNRPHWRTDFQGEMVVPEGHVFVMGDNRDNSSDGRFWGADGQLEDPEMRGRTVPIELLRGRAHIIWLASDWSRMFSFIP